MSRIIPRFATLFPGGGEGVSSRIPNRAYCIFASRGVTDTIGGLSITIVSGSLDDPLNCEFSFPYTTELGAVNTALGGGLILFDGETPIVRTGQQWYDMAQFNANNVDYLWMGFSRGQMRVLMYSTDTLPTGGRERALAWVGDYVSSSSFDELSVDQLDAMTVAEIDALTI